MPRKQPRREFLPVLSVGEVARRAGWSQRTGDKGYKRMRRYLETVNAQAHGLLLVNLGTRGRNVRWGVSEAALRRLHPSWFDDSEVLDALGATNRRVDELADKVSEHDEILEIQSREIGRLARLSRGRAA